MASPPRTLLRRQTARLVWLTQGLASLGLFLATLLLYLGTLTQVHTFDALSYVTSVERKPWTELFHPHHLAYGPLGLLALMVGRVVGADGAALPMQVVNALAGALGVTLFFGLVRRYTARADLALATALMLGSSYAYWYYAVEIEVYTVATLLLIVCLRLIPRLLEQPSTRDAAFLGLAQGGAVLFHQTNMLLCVPILLVLLTTGRHRSQTNHQEPPPQKPQLLLVYGLVLSLMVGVPYLAVGLGISGFRSWDAFVGWLLEYARTGWWGGPITASTWERLGQGLSEALAQPGGGPLGLVLLGLLVLRLRTLITKGRRLVLALLLWLLVYAAFFTWWEPDNIEFWIASMPPILLLLALALRGTARWGAELWVALAVGLTTLGLNHDAIVRRGDPARDLQRLVADAIGAQVRPADLVLVADELQELYLPYYERHDNFLSINQAMFEQGSDWGRACGAVRDRMEAALHAGATVVLADAVLHPPAAQLQRHQLRQNQIDDCFAPYQALLRALALPPDAPPHWHLPAAQELAEGSGWHFDTGPLGWRAANLDEQRFADGWQALPASDPWLLSPLLDIDTAAYRAIEIRLANTTRARDAQLFFATPDGTLDEGRSLRWTLADTDAPTTYRLELRDTPGWQGRIARLRIDPVGVGDGGALRIEWVRLVR